MKAALRRYRLRAQDGAVLALNLVGTGAGAMLTVLQFPDPTALHVLAGIIVVLGSVGAAAAALASANKLQDDASRATRKRLAASLVEDLCRATVKLASRCPDHTGMVVFLPSDQRGSNMLEATYEFNKTGKADANLRFGKYEGVAGHVWATGEQAFARLSEVSPEDLRLTWKLSPEYVSRTAHLKVVVATPIWAVDNPEQLLGVVTLDSECADEECELTSDESLDEALQSAQVLAQILKLADLV